MAYEVIVNLKDEDLENKAITIQVDTKGQARKITEAMKGRIVVITQRIEKVITFK